MATTRGFGRLTAVLLATAFLATAARAGDWMPLLPDQDFYDFQLFAPPDLQEYEIYPEASEGIFFSYDALYWGITGVSRTEVGTTQNGGYIIPSQPISPQAIVQLNNGSLQASAQNPELGQNVIGGIYIYGADPLQLDLNTTWMKPVMTWGNRYEGGWIYDGRGMALSYFDTGEQTQSFTTMSEFAASSPTQIFTQTTSGGGGVGGDGGGGGVGNINQSLTTTTITANSPPPDHLISQKFTQENITQIQSVGAAMIWRRELGRRGSGSTARFGFGARYMQLEDRFNLGYESNQYAFNQGPTGSTQGQGVNIGTAGGAAGAGAGGTGGAAGAGGAAGTGPGLAGGSGAAGAGGAGGNQAIPGAFGANTGLYANSAGDIIGIGGADTLTGQGVGSPLQTGAWETESLNNLVGPEFSLLLETTRGRWTFSSELKFVAGFNWQNLRYRGANFPDSIGADYLRATFNPSSTVTQSGLGSGTTGDVVAVTPPPPPLFLQIYGVGQQNATNDAEYQFRFSPIGEWRFGGQFRVSQAITLHAGYTGMAIGSIARAAANTAYRSVEKRTQYAEVLNSGTAASVTNPWVVKTTGTPPPDAVAVPGAPNTFKDAQGNYFTGEASPYYRQNPIYNRIGAGQDVQDVVFVNGVDVGLEIKY